MTGTHIPHDEVERILNDRENILILHTLDGEIWGASIAATDIFGYSNEELRQMCLVNIKPKALRLSDVCKDKMGDEAVVVFQKRNNRRFTANVKRNVISFIYQREPIELVFLELSLCDVSNDSKTVAPHIDINELTQFVGSLQNEYQKSVRDLSDHFEVLIETPLNDKQKELIDKLQETQSHLAHIGDNIVDSFQLAQNSLNLDSEPFNIIEFVASGILTLKQSEAMQQRLILSSDVPELIYGDKKIIEKVFRNILTQVETVFSPKSALLALDYSSNRNNQNKMSVSYTFYDCQKLEEKDVVSYHYDGGVKPNDKTDAQEILDIFQNSLSILFCRHLLRLMGGMLKLNAPKGNRIELNFEFILPEVHDLGLTRKINFLKGKQVVLVDDINSNLAIQLKAWGAQLEYFTKLEKAIDFVKTGASDISLFIVHGNQGPMQGIANWDVGEVGLVFIGVDEIPFVLRDLAVSLPLDSTIPEVGNVLSQVVVDDFPYPYYNVNSKRRQSNVCELGQLLVVSHDVLLRNNLVSRLQSMDVPVDEAVNGIDAVMASTNCRYDAIIIDDNLPYMDGVETSIHLRRVSHINKGTPVLIVTDDDSENGKLARSQAGISADILKPIDSRHFEQLIRSLLMQDRTKTEESVNEEIGLPVAGLRRSEEREGSEDDVVTIDEQVLDRLAKDTSIDVCKEMVDMFIEESLISLGEISKCCVAGDWNAILEHSYSLRSSCRTFGCEALYSVTLQLEEESRKNNMGECIRLASVLPMVFLQSQQNLYDYCSLYNRRSKEG